MGIEGKNNKTLPPANHLKAQRGEAAARKRICCENKVNGSDRRVGEEDDIP